LKPSFQWTAIAGASAYELLVSTNTDFENPVIVQTEKYVIPANAWQCDVSLDYNTVYYWKVKAVSESSSSSWSSTGIFTTENSPGDTPEPATVIPLLAQSSHQLAVPVPNPTIQAVPVPVIPTPTQIKPDSDSPQPIFNNTPSGLNGSVSLPVWIIYFIFSLLATIILALFVILVIVMKTKRF
jgi:hypothetical protein